MPVGGHFPILEETIRLDLDAKMAKPASADGRHTRLLRGLDYSPEGRDSSYAAPEFSSSATRINTQRCGSALKFRVVAAGEGDMYPRFGTTMEWDIAAGQALLEAAGGRAETLAGTPLAYRKPGASKTTVSSPGAAAKQCHFSLFLLFFAGNYQQESSRSPQKPWAGDRPVNAKTAKHPRSCGEDRRS